MSWSLEIDNGDLVFGGNGIATVTGAHKLTQDLRCAILEPMGIDDLHPTYGSVIDGGMLPDGTYQDGIIGGTNDAYAASFVQSELQRIGSNYQQAQTVRNQNDMTVYGRSTLTPDEVLLALENVQVTAIQNQMMVTVDLQTGSGPLSTSVPISS